MSELCNILVIESDQDIIEIVVPLLKAANCKVSYVKRGLNVVTHLIKHKFQIILLSDQLEDEDGFRILRRIREKDELKNLPVIIMLNDVERINSVFEHGGTDFIVKPLIQKKVSARINPYLNNIKKQKILKEQFAEKEQALKTLDQVFMEMEVMSRVDPLTSTLNRRTIIEKIEDELIRSRRSKREFTLLLVDIVNCKAFNKSFGYDCGDYIIKIVAHKIKEIVRELDFIGRWSGDKFLILLVETEIDGAIILENKINKSFSNNTIKFEEVSHKIKLVFKKIQYNGNDNMSKIIDEMII